MSRKRQQSAHDRDDIEVDDDPESGASNAVPSQPSAGPAVTTRGGPARGSGDPHAAIDEPAGAGSTETEDGRPDGDPAWSDEEVTWADQFGAAGDARGASRQQEWSADDAGGSSPDGSGGGRVAVAASGARRSAGSAVRAAMGPGRGAAGRSGSPTAADESADDWVNWLYENNPLYLGSVLLMFLGLFLVSKASFEAGVAGYGTVVSFFVVQNIYELLMVGMALYLFVHRINSRHGKILLALVTLFLSDLSFYLARISGMSAAQGGGVPASAVATIYLILAVAKVAAVVYYLGITPRYERLAYPLAVFAMIYFVPQWILQASSGTDAKQLESFDGHYVLYLIWLAAALLQLPVIIGSWRQSDLDQVKPHQYLGDENSFYRYLLLFAFVVLPLQIILNNEPDIRAKGLALVNTGYNHVPYLLAAVFFLQQFWRQGIEKTVSLKVYDFVGVTAVFLYAAIQQDVTRLNQGDFVLTPWRLHLAMILIAHLAMLTTRRNTLSAYFLGTCVAYYFSTALADLIRRGYEEVRTWSTLVWAQILMAGSFILLGVGFAVSVRGSRSRRLARATGGTATPAVGAVSGGPGSSAESSR